MAQTWHDLLFAHWAVEPQTLRALVPPQLDLDTWSGSAWVGVIPFRMSGIRARRLPALPGLSAFPELNVRTYVTFRGKPGVYFFSLDAANLPAVWAARKFYRLPYFHSQMSAIQQQDWIVYRCRRRRTDAEFRGRYRPAGVVQLRKKGSIEHWLTERYCLYAVHRSRVYRGEIHHLPWPLQDAEAEVETNTMAQAAGIELPLRPPILHFARRLEVLVWALRPAQ